MRMAMIGLGKMGGNMARRLCRGGIEVVGYNRSPEIVNALAAEEGMVPAGALREAVEKLTAPRVVWLMLPSGAPTEQAIEELNALLEQGDVIVDGGNSNYHDSQRRGATVAKAGIGYVDAGTSGGIWGLDNGYCLMVGGARDAVALVEPALKVLAPAPERGWAHVGPVGAGHFTKMIHNGIEYGMMQAMAEGFALMKGKSEFNLDLAQISELWRHSSVVRSWLLDLTADALKQDQQLDDIAPYVPDSGEGRWTVVESIDQGTAAPVLSLALSMRFTSQDEEGYDFKLLSMMRNAFGGHAVKKAGE
ncbi:6-phosphogluconate dehydrogenase [Candidatus Tenderia electrophaga]|jgi:6-phosphogluconate dehydrogenase|uniref:6-phosphogluconate dehydrogenase n=1 Tax=Candidatus Tenderia electrophaga TaxID=1748243 RepID=A0A0S2TBC3_9GAMM|nr:6-phosphogluconate dehydrogenase [Candidatus Tenderia electrophaga]